MKATLRLFALDPFAPERSKHLRRTLDDAPPVLFAGVLVCICPGGPIHRIKWSTFDPFTRSLSVKLEDLTLASGPSFEELIENGWEIDA